MFACYRQRSDGVQLFASSSLFEHCLNVIGRGIQQGPIKLASCASGTLAELFRFVHLPSSTLFRVSRVILLLFLSLSKWENLYVVTENKSLRPQPQSDKCAINRCQKQMTTYYLPWTGNSKQPVTQPSFCQWNEWMNEIAMILSVVKQHVNWNSTERHKN